MPRPPISVLKPLKGDEDELYENLRALAGQRYPEFEILCGAEDPADPALGVVRRLAAEMPAVPIRIVCGGAPIGLNPKVNNLAQLLPVARHELVLISDANVRPPPDYLAGLADQIAGPGVGLVHSPLVGVHERSVAQLLNGTGQHLQREHGEGSLPRKELEQPRDGGEPEQHDAQADDGVLVATEGHGRQQRGTLALAGQCYESGAPRGSELS